jgi:two-component system, cell cycle response regulator
MAMAHKHATTTSRGERSASFVSDRTLVVAVLAGLTWLAIYTVLSVGTRHSVALSSFVANVVYLLPIAAAVGIAGFAATRTLGRFRLVWWLLAASSLSWFAGEMAWTLNDYLSPGTPSTPSAADVGYVLQYVFALPAVLIGLKVGRPAQTRWLIDALLLGAGVTAIGWQLIIDPVVPDTWHAAALVAFLYPVLDLSIVSIFIAVGLSGRRPVPLPMALVGTAFGIAAVVDAGYTYAVALHSYSNSSWLNLGWQAEAVLFCLAAVVALSRADQDWRRHEVKPDLTILPALIAVLAVGGVAVFDKVRLGKLSDTTLAISMLLFAGLLVRQFIAIRDRTRLADQLRAAAVTDVLTGLPNRRYFEEALQEEAPLAGRGQRALSLIMLDLDNFKNVNDTYGHAAGDAVLAQAADRVRRCIQATDLTSRYGGEEFVCLLPGADEPSALGLAEHIRLGMSSPPMSLPDRPDTVRLTASLGVATVDTQQTGTINPDDLLNAADRALYQAKAGGRDRVVGANWPTSSEHDLGAEVPPAILWLADKIDSVLSYSEHSAVVAKWCPTVGARLGLDQISQRRAATAARLHDIGKVNVSRAILTKPGPLDAHEWAQMRNHPAEGARIIVEFTDRPDLAPIVAAHHERYDGKGYPLGIAGQDIPLEARIIAVCDAWAAMRVNRPYSRALTDERAREQLVRGRGSQFDPVVVDTFLALLDEGAMEEPARVRLSEGGSTTQAT